MTEERFDEHDKCAQIGVQDRLLAKTIAEGQQLNKDLVHALLRIHHWRVMIAKNTRKQYNLTHIIQHRFFETGPEMRMKWDLSEIWTQKRIVGTFTYKIPVPPKKIPRPHSEPKKYKTFTRKYTFE